MSMFYRAAAVFTLVSAVAGCAPQVQDFGPVVDEPSFASDSFVTADAKQLPYKIWSAEGEPEAVFVALHGFNDYRMAFDAPGRWWAAQGITTYAYDQRGFGQAPARGIWGGINAMAADARAMVALVRGRHPGVPVYLVGVSMGGAVALVTLSDPSVKVAGAVLVAPAVWGGEAMNPMFRAGIWLAAHTTPWNYATGRGLRRSPSDNIEMLRALGRDPLVIKRTRIDSVYGLTKLMAAGQAAAGSVTVPVLVLYGQKDEIVPPGPVFSMIEKLPPTRRVVHYPDGYHMLLRDLQGEVVWRDVAAWAGDQNGLLPSGFELGTLARSAAK